MPTHVTGICPDPQGQCRLQGGPRLFRLIAGSMPHNKVRPPAECLALATGRARQPFAWRGHHFGEGTWMILDLCGTNHDLRIWSDPGRFRPERFRDSNGSAFALIP